MRRRISNKCIAVIITFIIIVSACKPPKMMNAPTIPDSYYKFGKSKYQVINILDSLIDKSQLFFKEVSESSNHILLNFKDKVDTITFVLLFREEDLQNTKLNDSSILFVMSISRYINRKLDETPLYPKIDSLQKKIYLSKLDSFIIAPLRQQISKVQ